VKPQPARLVATDSPVAGEPSLVDDDMTPRDVRAWLQPPSMDSLAGGCQAGAALPRVRCVHVSQRAILLCHVHLRVSSDCIARFNSRLVTPCKHGEHRSLLKPCPVPLTHTHTHTHTHSQAHRGTLSACGARITVMHSFSHAAYRVRTRHCTMRAYNHSPARTVRPRPPPPVPPLSRGQRRLRLWSHSMGISPRRSPLSLARLTRPV